MSDVTTQFEQYKAARDAHRKREEEYLRVLSRNGYTDEWAEYILSEKFHYEPPKLTDYIQLIDVCRGEFDSSKFVKKLPLV